MQIFVNTKPHEFDCRTICYEEAVKLDGRDPSVTYTVTWTIPKFGGGVLTPQGNKVEVREGMQIFVAYTGNA